MHTATSTTNFRQSLGRMGESLAVTYLTERGWCIITTNYNAHRLGEIDIIAHPPGEQRLVFIEVKTRDIKLSAQIPALGLVHPGQMAMHPQKQKRLMRAAMNYLDTNPTGRGIRFDLILVDVEAGREGQASDELREIVQSGDLAALRSRSKILHLEEVLGTF
ncbi:MAG: YraN family protein [Cyanobacteria bacterium SZAS LIN-3]|nr:YraN family protein [Cyanobacteria bacterium SZAS LIN-3]MBS2007248.1 YraN family protein [Cyanobacteria bacterium SZAS TMP-1]